MRQALSKVSGSLTMNAPELFVEQSSLVQGSQVELQRQGMDKTVKASVRPRYKLTDLMAEMPDGLPRVEGWEEMSPVGLEIK